MNKLKLLNRNAIKIIAIVAMVMDHLAPILFESGSTLWIIFRIIGRITFPVMIYLLVDGFRYTRNLKKYIFRMFIFSIISLFTFSFLETGSFLPIQIVDGLVEDYPFSHIYFSAIDKTLNICMFSVITNLLLSLLTLTLWEKTKWKTPIKVLLTILMLIISLNCDWKYLPILMTLGLYYFRENKIAKWLTYLVISALYVFNIGITMNMFQFDAYLDIRFVLYRVGMILPFLLIVFFYNGKSGKKTAVSKWFFYIFYPAHQVVLGILSLIL